MFHQPGCFLKKKIFFHNLTRFTTRFFPNFEQIYSLLGIIVSSVSSVPILCWQEFALLERLEQHMESVSPTNCNHCGKIICHESRLRQHLATSHLGESIPARPVDLSEPIIGQTPYQDLAEYKEILDMHTDVIRSDETTHLLWKRINCEIDPVFLYSDLKSLLMR